MFSNFKLQILALDIGLASIFTKIPEHHGDDINLFNGAKNWTTNYNTHATRMLQIMYAWNHQTEILMMYYCTL